jgi:hypothetical protein
VVGGRVGRVKLTTGGGALLVVVGGRVGRVKLPTGGGALLVVVGGRVGRVKLPRFPSLNIFYYIIKK